MLETEEFSPKALSESLAVLLEALDTDNERWCAVHSALKNILAYHPWDEMVGIMREYRINGIIDEIDVSLLKEFVEQATSRKGYDYLRRISITPSLLATTKCVPPSLQVYVENKKTKDTKYLGTIAKPVLLMIPPQARQVVLIEAINDEIRSQVSNICMSWSGKEEHVQVFTKDECVDLARLRTDVLSGTVKHVNVGDDIQRGREILVPLIEETSH